MEPPAGDDGPTSGAASDGATGDDEATSPARTGDEAKADEKSDKPFKDVLLQHAIRLLKAHLRLRG